MVKGQIKIAKGNDLPLCARLISYDEYKRPVIVPCEEVDRLSIYVGMGSIERAVQISIERTESNCVHFRLDAEKILTRVGVYNVWVTGRWRGNDVSQNYEGLVEVLEFSSRVNALDFIYVDEQEIAPSIFIPASPTDAEYQQIIAELQEKVEEYNRSIELLNAEKEKYAQKVLELGDIAQEVTLGVPSDLGNGEVSLSGMLRMIWNKINNRQTIEVHIDGEVVNVYADETYASQGYEELYGKNHYTWEEVPADDRKEETYPTVNDSYYTTYTQDKEPVWVYCHIDGMIVKLDSEKTYKEQGYAKLYGKSEYAWDEVPEDDRHENEMPLSAHTYYTTYTQEEQPSENKCYVGGADMTRSEFNAITIEQFEQLMSGSLIVSGREKEFTTNKKIFMLAIPTDGSSISNAYYINELGKQTIDADLWLTKEIEVDGVAHTLYGFRDATISENRTYYYTIKEN